MAENSENPCPGAGRLQQVGVVPCIFKPEVRGSGGRGTAGTPCPILGLNPRMTAGLPSLPITEPPPPLGETLQLGGGAGLHLMPAWVLLCPFGFQLMLGHPHEVLRNQHQ